MQSSFEVFYLNLIRIVAKYPRWKIRCTDQQIRAQYIENKLYRRLGSKPPI